MIKKTSTVIFFFFLLMLPLYADPLETAYLSMIEGDVQIKMNESDEWVPASVNTPLAEGDRLWIPAAGRLEIYCKDGTSIRLDELSSLEVLSLTWNTYRFHMIEGDAYINFRGTKDSLFQFETPKATVSAYARSRFRVDAGEEGEEVEISVYRGEVFAETNRSRTKVLKKTALKIDSDSITEYDDIGAPDGFETWNFSRDRQVRQANMSKEYLPDDLKPYSTHFDLYGRWVYVQDHGYAWAPTEYVSRWMPYRNGRWIWRGGDYVWISYEPWGWAPYHYGRWINLSGRGWYWVPPASDDLFWGPGYVAWFSEGSYIGWVPLAPRETYYGRGHHGRHSVSVHDLRSYDIQEKIEHHKNFKYGTMVIHNDDFIYGNRAYFDLNRIPFKLGQILYGRPVFDHKHEAASKPVVKTIPEKHAPPQRVRVMKVGEVKQNKPVKVKETYPQGRSTPVVKVKDQKDRTKWEIPTQKQEHDSKKTQKSQEVIKKKTREKKAPDKQQRFKETKEEKKLHIK